MKQDQELRQDVQASEEAPSIATKYNIQLVKNYIKNARFTMWALLIIWVMFIIECIYTFITFGTLFGPSSIPAIILLKMGANNGLLVKLGQVHRLFMAIILHGGLLHIFFNTATLIAFCAQLEAVVDFKLYIAVFIIGGIQGNMLSDLYNINLGNIATVGIGASTAICAIMGLYMAKLYIQSKKNGTVELAKRKILTMLVYLFIISILPSVDFFGHFGSLISGGLIGLAIIPRGDPEVKKLSLLGIAGFCIYTVILFAIFL